MCRYDDGDYEWYVEATFREVLGEGEQIHCEDCGRTVGPNETIVRYAAAPGSEWDDERPYVHIVFEPWRGQDPDKLSRYWIEGTAWWAILDDDTPPEIFDAFDALGFAIDEDRDPRVPAEAVPDHFSCVQCKAAERWLVEVCDQHVVLVTKYDLIDHTYDYDAATLGPAFMTLVDLARRGWRHPRFDRLVPERVIARLTDRAVKHAQLVGLHPE